MRRRLPPTSKPFFATRKYQFAYVFLALNYAEAWLSQRRQEPQTPAQALEAAQRAVALNASSSAAHVALGVAALLNKHYAQAEAEVERILALNPGSADLYASAAGILNWVGRPAEAIGLMEQSLHLNPKPSSLYFLSLGHAYYLLGRTAEAIAPLQRVLSVYPHRIDTHVLLAAVYSELGKTQRRGRRPLKSCDSIRTSHWKFTNKECRSKIQQCWSGILRRCARRGLNNGE